MLLLYLVLLGLPVTAREVLQPLTKAADIIALPADEASRHFPVTVTGIVTAADPAFHGRFFLQDATSGVFVDNANGQRPEPGELLEVTGVTDAGAYAPIISTPRVRQLGTGPLPEAKPVSIERLMAGAEDSQRIEIGGIVRAARTDATHLILDLVSGGYRFRVLAPLQPNADPAALVAAQVRVRGTAAEAHNRSLRRLVFPEVYVPRPSDFVVEQGVLADPFANSVVPLASLAQYRRDSSFNERVHVKGVVTLQRLGESLFLQDAAGALQIQSRQLTRFSPGDTVEAVGFPSFENFLPVLQDALCRPVAGASRPVAPKAATLEEIENGFHHAEFISFDGKLIDRTSRQTPRGPTPAQNRTGLVLQNGDTIFAADVDELPGRAEMATLPIGSMLKVSGVCLTEIDSEGKMKAFRLLVGNPQNVLLVARPSWFTPRHLLISLGIVLVALVVIVTWTVMITRRNSVLRFLIREREEAQLELQRAHDQLEERVKQRTAELKFQITARNESELQFKGVLAERTRLAQELHDTVEQTLTGIALQLDTAAKLYERSPDSALHHLELARNLMAKSQVEVRRSVWDLRCRALEQFDLSGALMGEARQMTNGTNLRVELETKGQARPLPEVVEENLLRIGQEALTNVLKHSKATLARIELNFDSDQVSLQIQDNGKGFSPDVALGANDGHFGLLGMAERVKRLNGRFHVRSAPGQGATVRAEIPVEALKPSVPVPSYEPLPT